MLNIMSEIVRRRLNQENNPEYRDAILDLLSLVEPKFEETIKSPVETATLVRRLSA